MQSLDPVLSLGQTHLKPFHSHVVCAVPWQQCTISAEVMLYLFLGLGKLTASTTHLLEDLLLKNSHHTVRKPKQLHGETNAENQSPAQFQTVPTYWSFKHGGESVP